MFINGHEHEEGRARKVEKMKMRKILMRAASWMMCVVMTFATIGTPTVFVSANAAEMSVENSVANAIESNVESEGEDESKSGENTSVSGAVVDNSTGDAAEGTKEDNTSAPKETIDSQETSISKENDDSQGTIDSQETTDSQGTTDTQETTDSQGSIDSEETSKTEETDELEEPTDSNETLDAEETDDSEEIIEELLEETEADLEKLDDELSEEALLEGEEPEAQNYVTMELTDDPENAGFKILTITGEGKMTECPSPELRKQVSKIIISEGVTEIPQEAFFWFEEARSVEIADSVVAIRKSAFSACKKLEYIDLPQNLTILEAQAFMTCTGLKEISIPEGIKSTPYRLFYNCASLKTVNLPQTLTKVGEETFAYCKSLESIIFPDSVTEIDHCVFWYCESLKTFKFPSKVEKVNTNMFYGCKSLETVELTDNILAIEGGAFYNCTSLKELDLPDGVHTIGNGAFAGVVAPTKLFINCKKESPGWKYIGITDQSIVTIKEHECPSWNKGYCIHCGKKSIVTGGKIEIRPVNYAYDGKSHRPSAEIYIDNVKIPSAEFSFIGDSQTEVGVYTMTIESDSAIYCESVTATWQITPSGLYCDPIPDQVYTGKAIKPELEVYADGRLLKKNKDYTITYKNNTAVRNKDAKTIYNRKEVSIAPTAVITGKGNYSGSYSMTFNIVPANIEEATMDGILLSYTGKDIALKPVVKMNGKTLSLNKDYVIFALVGENHYSQITTVKEPGEYTFYVKGMRDFTGAGNYRGVKELHVKVSDDVFVSKLSIGKIPNQEYTGSPVKVNMSDYIKYQKKAIDNFDEKFEVSYEDHTVPGKAKVTITAKKDSGFVGTRIIYFNITGINLSKAKLDTAIPSAQYSGFKYEPKINVSVNGIPLVEGEDYTAEYSNCINAGTASVVIIGKNGYSGTKKFTYKITPFDVQNDPNGYIEVFNTESAWYNRNGSKPSTVVEFKKRWLTEKIDYTCTYKNNKKVISNDAVDSKGRSIAPEITITFKGNYKGKLTRKYEIKAAPLGDGNGTLVIDNKQYSSKAYGWKQTSATLYDAFGQKLIAGVDYSKNFEYYSDYKYEENITDQKYIDFNGYGASVYVRVVGINGFAGKEIRGCYYLGTRSIAKASITVNVVKEYTGKEVTLNREDITAKLDGYSVPLDIVYSSYKNNINKGTASVVVKGGYGYYGTRTIKFKIGTKSLKWWE